jgi:hypothetical protein
MPDGGAVNNEDLLFSPLFNDESDAWMAAISAFEICQATSQLVLPPVIRCGDFLPKRKRAVFGSGSSLEADRPAASIEMPGF